MSIDTYNINLHYWYSFLKWNNDFPEKYRMLRFFLHFELSHCTTWFQPRKDA
jgi:hypothetical protein